jgi:DNA-binding NarL/FixJ family response regulator
MMPGTNEAVRLVTDLLHDGRPVPFILLTEDADEKTVADIIATGTWNYLAKSRLDGATLVRTIHNTVAAQLPTQANRARKNPRGSYRVRSNSRRTRS